MTSPKIFEDMKFRIVDYQLGKGHREGNEIEIRRGYLTDGMLDPLVILYQTYPKAESQEDGQIPFYTVGYAIAPDFRRLEILDST